MTFEHFSFRPYAPPLTCLAMYRTHVAVSLYVWEKKKISLVRPLPALKP